MAAALGVPYVITNSRGIRERAHSIIANRGQTPEGGTTSPPAAQPGSAWDDPTLVGETAGPSVQDFTEVFRFDVTPAWVLGRWPRVSTQLPDTSVQGYRVPLVTGTREDDLAGSLTYYFNRQQKVQRIHFFGTTGDARRLVSMVVSQFGFERQPNAGAGLFLYQVKWNGKPVSELRVQPAKVVSAADPNRRFEVALAIERPRGMDRLQPFAGTRNESPGQAGTSLFAPYAESEQPAAIPQQAAPATASEGSSFWSWLPWRRSGTAARAAAPTTTPPQTAPPAPGGTVPTAPSAIPNASPQPPRGNVSTSAGGAATSWAWPWQAPDQNPQSGLPSDVPSGQSVPPVHNPYPVRINTP